MKRIKVKMAKCTGCGAIIRHLSIDIRKTNPDFLRRLDSIKCPICSTPIEKESITVIKPYKNKEVRR